MFAQRAKNWLLVRIRQTALELVPLDSRASNRSGRRVRELDGLRAFAILPVILFHCYPEHGPLRWLYPIGAVGWIGVDLFFVLSGYLITGILLDAVGTRHYYRNFIARRTLRIFPLYYLCLVLFTLAVWLNGSPASWEALRKWGGPNSFFFYAGNIRSVVEKEFPPVLSFVPLWSLQVEEQFYLVYPLIVWLLPVRRLRRFLIACVLVAPVCRLLIVIFRPEYSLSCYVLMPCRMDALSLGGLVAVMIRSGKPRLSLAGWRWMVAIGIAMVVATFSIGGCQFWDPLNQSIGYSVIDATFASLLALILSCPTGRLIDFLCWQPFVYIGQISYGMYLLHVPAARIGRAVLSVVTPVEPQSALAAAVMFGASILAASISWRFFESKLLVLKDRFTG